MKKEQIREELKLAMKAGDTFKRNMLRLLISEIDGIDRDLFKDGIPSEKKSLEIIKFLIKGADTPEEAEFFKTYLPQPLSEEEVLKIVEDIITEQPDIQRGPLFGAIKKVNKLADADTIKKVLNEYYK
jgi:uncharacterized protein YqeY